MTTGQPLGALVAAIINDGFLETAEARPRVCGAVFHAQRLEDIHHEVRAGLLIPADLHGATPFSGSRTLIHLLRPSNWCCNKSSGANCCAFQKTPSSNRSFCHSRASPFNA